MTDLKISLQPQPVQDSEHESLQYLISRINEHKGGFRDVTEQSLEDEINNGAEETVISEDEEIDAGEEQAEDETSKQEIVWKAREEMMSQVA